MKIKLIATIMIMLFLASITVIAVPVKAGYGTPTIDGVRDACYELVVTDIDTESGYLPIKIYTAFDNTNVYWFFEATDPSTSEQGIGGTNILWDADGDGYFWEDPIAYLQEAVYDNEGIWTSTPLAGSDIARHSYFEGGIEIWDTLEVQIPRSYADCNPWQYDVWTISTPMRNTGWGTTSYGDLNDPAEWLSCPVPPPLWVKASGGGEFYDDYTGDHCTIGLIGMSLSAVLQGETIDYKGSGTFVDHDKKMVISLDVTFGRLTLTGKKEVQFWGTAHVKDIYLHDKWTGTFWIGLVDDTYGNTNRFALHLYKEGVKIGHWHGTLLPDSEVTVWVWE